MSTPLDARFEGLDRPGEWEAMIAEPKARHLEGVFSAVAQIDIAGAEIGSKVL
jgi:hypothetical protein